MKNILTALQPSGILHIGNYFGAIKPFVNLQENNKNYLFAVDYHAITIPQDPKALRENILFAVAVYLACGVDPHKTTIFQQSQVPQHTELAWILNCVAHMGELERMIQYKDKAKGKGQNVTVGLFDYPILMAADILMYDTNVVPVGHDQKQHVELARDIAQRFNHQFGDTFIVPDVEIQKHGARIMGLDNPQNKMSKSAPSPKNYISLMDDDKTIEKKIKSAVTDSGSEIELNNDKPAIKNLLNIFSLVTEKPPEKIAELSKGKGYAEFKSELAKAVIEWITPLRDKIEETRKDEKMLIEILNKGSQQARDVAQKKMETVRKAIGVKL
ncbi:MAG: tryptophan--tRNA ligase [Patescibacteria group bacterium]